MSCTACLWTAPTRSWAAPRTAQRRPSWWPSPSDRGLRTSALAGRQSSRRQGLTHSGLAEPVTAHPHARQAPPSLALLRQRRVVQFVPCGADVAVQPPPNGLFNAPLFHLLKILGRVNALRHGRVQHVAA